MKPIDYPLTRIFETQSLSEIDEIISSTFIHLDNELPIAITHVDIDNWTLLTTKKIISNIKGVLRQTFASKVVNWTWGDFKGYKEKPTTLGHLTLDDNTTLNILTETGKASMIMIYGIMTLTGQETSTEEQINRTLNRYQNRGFFDQLD
jgi:hypothetical protein